MGTAPSRTGGQTANALFGRTRQTVLRLLFAPGQPRLYLRQILRAAGGGSGAVQRELKQLAGAGIVNRAVEGAQTYYQANPACPIYEDLRNLVRKSFGVAGILQLALDPLRDRIRAAFIFGSVASGQEAPSSDIDVMVVGDAIVLDEVVAAFAGTERELGREVNPAVYRTGEFCRKLSEGQHFVSQVSAGAKIFLIGDEGELAGLASVRMAERPPHKPGGNLRPARRRRP